VLPPPPAPVSPGPELGGQLGVIATSSASALAVTVG
jgi:hypothetical protein